MKLKELKQKIQQQHLTDESNENKKPTTENNQTASRGLQII